MPESLAVRRAAESSSITRVREVLDDDSAALRTARGLGHNSALQCNRLLFTKASTLRHGRATANQEVRRRESRWRR